MINTSTVLWRCKWDKRKRNRKLYHCLSWFFGRQFFLGIDLRGFENLEGLYCIGSSRESNRCFTLSRRIIFRQIDIWRWSIHSPFCEDVNERNVKGIENLYNCLSWFFEGQFFLGETFEVLKTSKVFITMCNLPDNSMFFEVYWNNARCDFSLKNLA